MDKNEKKYDMKFLGEVGEDATKYGEFISSYFHWLEPEEQKRKAKTLEEITDENNK